MCLYGKSREGEGCEDCFACSGQPFVVFAACLGEEWLASATTLDVLGSLAHYLAGIVALFHEVVRECHREQRFAV